MSVTLAPITQAEDAPYANWANGNAGPVIAVVAPGRDLWTGEPLTPEEVPDALSRVVRAPR